MPIDRLVQEKKFTHDCKECFYLGSTYDENDEWHDLYACDIGVRPTLIDRYGNIPGDYSSGIEFVSSLPMIRRAAAEVVRRFLEMARPKRGKSYEEEWLDLGYRVGWSDREPRAYEIWRAGCLPSDSECLVRLRTVQEVDAWVKAQKEVG